MSLVYIILLICSAGLGSVAAWLMRKQTKNEVLSILLSFTGAYLLGVTVIHLLPEVFAYAKGTAVPLFIFAGFFVQLVIVQFTRGIEHGHLHLHDPFSKGYVSGVFFGLSMHAFLEGIPLAATGMDIDGQRQIFLAVLVHKLPESFALATVLFFSFKNVRAAIALLIVFIAMTPLGGLFGGYLTHESVTHSINWLLALVSGTFIHISTTIIFEAGGKTHRISIYKLLAIIAGALITYVAAMV